MFMITTKLNVFCESCGDNEEVSVSLRAEPVKFTNTANLVVDSVQSLIPMGWIFNNKTSKFYCKCCMTQIKFYDPKSDDYSGESQYDYEFG